MKEIIIPGSRKLRLEKLVLDFNGTIAVDGNIIPHIIPLLKKIAKKMEIYILTADTFGTVTQQCAFLPYSLFRLNSENHTKEKGEIVDKLGADTVVAVGNGRNDLEMIKKAALGIGVIGREGCAGEILQNADIIVSNVIDGLDLLLNEKRLVATLRQ